METAESKPSETTAVSEPPAEAVSQPAPAPSAAPPSPIVDTRTLILHYLVPAPKPENVPAHQISGGPPTGIIKLASQIRSGLQIGRRGVAYVPACNARIVIGKKHRGTNVASCLVDVVATEEHPEGEMGAYDNTCQACLATAAWQEAIAREPHPKLPREVHDGQSARAMSVKPCAGCGGK